LARYGGTLEATVEDLLAQKTVNTTEPLATSPPTQGFSGYPMLLEIAKLGEETLTTRMTRVTAFLTAPSRRFISKKTGSLPFGSCLPLVACRVKSFMELLPLIRISLELTSPQRADRGSHYSQATPVRVRDPGSVLRAFT
jgi:hypothetical protein